MDLPRDVIVAAAAATTGLLAGLYYAYACSVMLGLGGTADRAFVDVMQRINVAILNGWFLLSFLGAPALTALALVLHLGEDQRSAVPWIATAAVLNLAAFLVTAAANVPLNKALEAAGPPGDIADPATVRERFERRWVRWNVVRAAASTAALVALVVALPRVGT